MTRLIVARRYCGPPNSGNGGYVSGLLANTLGVHASVALRAPIPLDKDMTFLRDGENGQLRDGETLIAEAKRADRAALPVPPPAPSLEEAREAGKRFVSFHPICLTCADKLGPTESLCVHAGQRSDAPQGQMAAVWTADASFADEHGVLGEEFVWAALDCPGFYAWAETEGRHFALLGTMQAEVLTLPRAGREYVVSAWTLEQQSARKRTSGVALYDADGALMARALQVWIRMDAPQPPAG
ncbi:MAG: hypothetical protein ABW199_05535 [Caulobacterales bacterium]